MGEVLGKLFIDVTTLPGHDEFDFYGNVQLLFLALCYGYVLFFASNLISDGSELLLLVPSLAGLVGSIVLPVLGAVPDGAIVLFSGLGPDAQEQLSVGVGALAGSTIMLLTIPWSLAIVAGRVNILADGRANYHAKPSKRLVPANNYSMTGTGVQTKPIVALNGKIMMLTSLAYFIIQVPAFGLGCGEKTGENCHGAGEHWWALFGLVFCAVAFFGYLYWQVLQSHSEERENEVVEAVKKAVRNGEMALTAVFAEMLLNGDDGAAGNGHADETSSLVRRNFSQNRFMTVTKTFFQEYDKDGNGEMDVREISALLKDVGENLSDSEVQAFVTEMDADGNGTINLEEFAECLKRLVCHPMAKRRNSLAVAGYVDPMDEEQGGADEDADDDEEEEEVPEDFVDLPYEEQQRRIKTRSYKMMTIGTVLVLLFSDPMVDVFSELGHRTGISPFYVSFVLAPVASNASELLAAYNYALKKTKKTITISFAALEGAACMNNTFCLGIFLALVFFRGLVWEFSAETISIIAVQCLMYLMAIKKTHYLSDAVLVMMLFPVSIIIVWVLEHVGLN